MIRAYVDGSFSNGRCGWGVVISNGPYSPGMVIYEASGVLKNDHGHRQVGGELKSAMVAITWVINNKVQEMELVYDYEGIRRWVTGEWNAKKALTKLYRTWMRNQIERFDLLICWIHTKSHTGDQGNERADRLAGEATRGVKP